MLFLFVCLFFSSFLGVGVTLQDILPHRIPVVVRVVQIGVMFSHVTVGSESLYQGGGASLCQRSFRSSFLVMAHKCSSHLDKEIIKNKSLFMTELLSCIPGSTHTMTP